MYLECVFYTSDFIVHGFIDSHLERISDFLNIKTETTIVLYDVKVSKLLNLTKSLPMSIPEVRLEKQSILFAIPMEGEKSQTIIYRRANRLVYPVKVFLPGFTLIGSIHLIEKFDIRRVLLGRPDDFVPLTDVTASYLLNPAASINRNIIIFNRNRMIMIGEHIQEDVSRGQAAENAGSESKKP